MNFRSAVRYTKWTQKFLCGIQKYKNIHRVHTNTINFVKKFNFTGILSFSGPGNFRTRPCPPIGSAPESQPGTRAGVSRQLEHWLSFVRTFTAALSFRSRWGCRHSVAERVPLRFLSRSGRSPPPPVQIRSVIQLIFLPIPGFGA